MHLKKIKELVKKHYPAKCNIYAYICDVIGRVEMHEKYFFVIFDVEENHQLERSVEKKFYKHNHVLERDREERTQL